jgi:hypothetical protein
VVANSLNQVDQTDEISDWIDKALEMLPRQQFLHENDRGVVTFAFTYEDEHGVSAIIATVIGGGTT